MDTPTWEEFKKCLDKWLKENVASQDLSEEWWGWDTNVGDLLADDRLASFKELHHRIEQEAREDALKRVAPWIRDQVGASSRTLFLHMTVGDAVSGETFPSAPSDLGDRGRCIFLLNLFPEWWPRLDEMSTYPYWEEQIPLIREEARTGSKSEGV